MGRRLICRVDGDCRGPVRPSCSKKATVCFSNTTATSGCQPLATKVFLQPSVTWHTCMWSKPHTCCPLHRITAFSKLRTEWLSYSWQQLKPNLGRYKQHNRRHQLVLCKAKCWSACRHTVIQIGCSSCAQHAYAMLSFTELIIRKQCRGSSVQRTY